MKNKLWLYAAAAKCEDGTIDVVAGLAVAPTRAAVAADLSNGITSAHWNQNIAPVGAADLARIAKGIPGLMVWHDARQELPDDELTVMVALANGEVWLGFHTEEDWRQVSAETFDQRVTYWADLPTAPKQSRAKKGGAA